MNRAETGIPIQFLNEKNYERARAEKPWIKKLVWTDEPIKRRIYRVRGRTVKHKGPYLVTLSQDLDGQRYVKCTCPAGTPPHDAYGIPKYEPRGCYHAAAALNHNTSLAARVMAKRKAQLSPAQLIFGHQEGLV